MMRRFPKLGAIVIITFLLLTIGISSYLILQETNLKSNADLSLYGKKLNITLTPNKSAYMPGETISIQIIGNKDVKTIAVNYIESARNIIQKPYVSVPIAGSYDSTLMVWKGTWKVPDNGEFLIIANVTNKDGILCSGNPGYSCDNCGLGTKVSGNLAPGNVACNGSYKTITVDSHYDAEIQQLGYDMKNYFNLNPGNRWLYTGTNTKCGTIPNVTSCSQGSTSFETYAVVEEKTTMCGHTLTPLRLTKSNVDGYILTHRPDNYRIFFSVFEQGEPWSNNSIGKVASKIYMMNGNPTLGNLGTEIGPGHEHFAGGNLYYHTDESHDFLNQYYAPHTFTPRWVDTSWVYEKVERWIDTSKSALESCNWDYKLPTSNIIERYGHNSIYLTTVSTPAYSGPALRLSMYEGRFPLGSGWFLREDWYFAPGIGRVQIDYKDEFGYCRGLASDPADCDKSKPMTNPDITMKLKSYYVGGKLTVSLNSNTVKPEYSLATATNNSKNKLYVKDQNGIPYTGYLEAKTCIGESTCTPGSPFIWSYNGTRATAIWVNNGVAEYDFSLVSNKTPGLRQSYFRPWVESKPTDAKGENVLTDTELPWSSAVLIRIQ